MFIKNSQVREHFASFFPHSAFLILAWWCWDFCIKLTSDISHEIMSELQRDLLYISDLFSQRCRTHTGCPQKEQIYHIFTWIFLFHYSHPCGFLPVNLCTLFHCWEWSQILTVTLHVYFHSGRTVIVSLSFHLKISCIYNIGFYGFWLKFNIGKGYVSMVGEGERQSYCSAQFSLPCTHFLRSLLWDFFMNLNFLKTFLPYI